MTTIDSREMRARVLARFERPVAETVDWQTAMSVDGNRKLLGLILGQEPRSINELAALAGRAQPNVSRSLVALVRAGLVELRQNGRASTPVATALGQEKAAALDIVDASNTEARKQTGDGKVTLMSVGIEDAFGPLDRIWGELVVRLQPKAKTALLSRGRADLTSFAERWASDWWRMLYRRDMPYRLCELVTEQDGHRIGVIIMATSAGRHINVSARCRKPGGDTFERCDMSLPLAAFASALHNGVLSPVAQELSRRGELDQTLHGSLAKLAEANEDARDLSYCRTVGALGLSLDKLTQDDDSLIQRLIDEVPGEEARLEFASALAPDEVAAANIWVESELKEHRKRNSLGRLNEIVGTCRSDGNLAGLKPVERGIALAKHVRSRLHLAVDRPIGGLAGLAGAFGAPDYKCSPAAPGQLLGFQSYDDTAPVVVANGDGGNVSAFLLARAIGDYVAFGDRRMPIVEIYTDRQAVGRAFAAELIAPSEAVVDMIDQGLSWMRVANHFGATSRVIRHQFDNNAWRSGNGGSERPSWGVQ